MQTTLRLDDRLYREAKAEAARQGVTLTRFLEQGIRLRLEMRPLVPGKPHEFRVYESDQPCSLSPEQIKRIADEEQEAHDMRGLGVSAPGN